MIDHSIIQPELLLVIQRKSKNERKKSLAFTSILAEDLLVVVDLKEQAEMCEESNNLGTAQCQFCQILSGKVIHKTTWIQGVGNRLHL